MNFSFLKLFALCLVFLRGRSGRLPQLKQFLICTCLKNNMYLVDAINCYECDTFVGGGYDEDTCLDFGDNTPTNNCAGQNYCLNAYANGKTGYKAELHRCGSDKAVANCTGAFLAVKGAAQ